MAIENPDYNLAAASVDFDAGTPKLLTSIGFLSIERAAGEPAGVFVLRGDLAGFSDRTLPAATCGIPGGPVDDSTYSIRAQIVVLSNVRVLLVAITKWDGTAKSKVDVPFTVTISRLPSGV